ncbi:MAG: hypothetical protein KatS3mg104_2022 [Phycisphaerae bacterium]|nr:MAG: hypothetical protein KatS3mg104_2022 [Phycisphaerae bacterium]
MHGLKLSILGLGVLDVDRLCDGSENPARQSGPRSRSPTNAGPSSTDGRKFETVFGKKAPVTPFSPGSAKGARSSEGPTDEVC